MEGLARAVRNVSLGARTRDVAERSASRSRSDGGERAPVISGALLRSDRPSLATSLKSQIGCPLIGRTQLGVRKASFFVGRSENCASHACFLSHDKRAKLLERRREARLADENKTQGSSLAAADTLCSASARAPADVLDDGGSAGEEHFALLVAGLVEPVQPAKLGEREAFGLENDTGCKGSCSGRPWQEDCAPLAGAAQRDEGNEICEACAGDAAKGARRGRTRRICASDVRAGSRQTVEVRCK